MERQTFQNTSIDALPVLDLSLLAQGEDAVAEFQEKLREVTHTIGFFYLVGHGIPDQTIQQLFEEARTFFALPFEEKKKIEMVKSPQFRGYTRAGGEYTRGKMDWREQIDLGAERPLVDDPNAPTYMQLDGPNQWPEAQPSLRPAFVTWEAHCTRIARRLMQQWALTLGAAGDTFEAAIGDKPSTLTKLVRYPGRETRGQGVGAHKDPGMLTMLMIEEGKGGLQVEYNDQWIDVPQVPGAFVINIGELLEYATDGYLKATVHRVVTPEAGDERLSIPFFFNPALDAQIPKIDLPEALAKNARGVTEDPNNVIYSTFGENLLKLRLRAHPDVAEAHYPELVSAESSAAE